MYDGTMRKPMIATVTKTRATNRNPMKVRPDCCRVRMIPLPSANAAADSLECQTAYVIPVEPDEKRLAPDVVVGHEAPVAAVVAVVAVVAHHEVLSGRHLAGEAAIIVNAVLLAGERPHVQRIHGLRCRVLRDRILASPVPLGQLLGCDVHQALEVAVI